MHSDTKNIKGDYETEGSFINLSMTTTGHLKKIRKLKEILKLAGREQDLKSLLNRIQFKVHKS
jgi:hypothetical protein